MLLHNLSKIERITERETRTSRFIPQLRRRTHGKRSAVNSDTYSGESVLVSGTNSHCTTTTTTITSTNTNTTSTFTTTTTNTFIRTTANHNQRRLQRKAVQSICDFGLILPAAVHFQSLDYAKVSASSTTSTSSSSTLHSSKTNTTSKLLGSAMSSSSAATSGSSSNNTTKAASATTKKRSTGGFLSGSRNAQARKASLDEKDSGSVDSAGSVGKHHEQQQRSSVDISILLTDDDSSSRLSDTGKLPLR